MTTSLRWSPKWTNDLCITILDRSSRVSGGLPTWIIQEDLPGRRLELVLREQATIRLPLLGIYPSRKYLSAKVRTFLDFITHDRRLK
jgi:DNA-binding transcriptional LysR family regulator